MSIKVAISTISWKHEDMSFMFEMFKALEFRLAEFHLAPVFIARDKPSYVLRLARDNDVDIDTLSGGWCDFFIRDSKYPGVYKNVKEQIEIARALGTHKIRLFFGKCPADYFFHDIRKRAVDRIRQIAYEHQDILFLFENHTPGSIANMPHLVCDMLLDVGRPNVKTCFDFRNYEDDHFSAPAALTVFDGSELIGHVHFKTIPRILNIERFPFDPPERQVVRWLNEIGYDGTITIESENSSTPAIACLRTKKMVEGWVNEA